MPRQASTASRPAPRAWTCAASKKHSSCGDRYPSRCTDQRERNVPS
nr:hypothetical protein [Nannocystis pusilla]